MSHGVDRRRRQLNLATLIVVGALVGACSGTAPTAPPGNPFASFGFGPGPSPNVPSGDACSVLAAADFASFGLEFTSTDHILGNPADCEVTLTDKTNGSTARPDLEFVTPDDFDNTQSVYGGASASENDFVTVTGIGDSAYAFNAFGDTQLYVKAKGYVFYVGTDGLGNAIGSGDELSDAKTIATEVVAKL